MFGKSINLFRLLGFQVRVDPSWIIIALLITWSLSVGFFPFQIEGLPARTYWIMGIVGAVGLFVSIVLHELSHSVVARKYGLQMKGITLFIFGGVAEMPDDPPSPKAEFMMAVAGPVSSLLIALVFYGIYAAGAGFGVPDPVNAVVIYLAIINGLLAVFNTIPAFPLDGGRMLRSVLWGIKGNIRWATRISSSIGSGFGAFLIVLGILSVIAGNVVGGVWWVLIGIFVYSAASMSYQQLVTRRALEGEVVRRFMNPEPVTVSPDMTLREVVDDYVYRYHHKMYPVVSGDHGVSGCITTGRIKEVPREEWHLKPVGEIAVPCDRENTVRPDTDAIQALSLMNQTGNSRLMVMEGDELVGIISLKDLMAFLSLRVELDI